MHIAQVHILIVHIPVLGSLLVLFLGIRAIKRQKSSQYKSFYWVSLAVAVFSAIAYFTGPDTATWVQEQMQNYPKEILETHALWGRIAFSVSVLSGLLGIMALANYAQEEKPHSSVPWIALFISLLLVIIFAYTAHIGGYIRRPDLM